MLPIDQERLVDLHRQVQLCRPRTIERLTRLPMFYRNDTTATKEDEEQARSTGRMAGSILALENFEQTDFAASFTQHIVFARDRDFVKTNPLLSTARKKKLYAQLEETVSTTRDLTYSEFIEIANGLWIRKKIPAEKTFDWLFAVYKSAAEAVRVLYPQPLQRDRVSATLTLCKSTIERARLPEEQQTVVEQELYHYL